MASPKRTLPNSRHSRFLPDSGELMRIVGDARIGQTICLSLVVCATAEIDPTTHDVVISFHCGHFAHHVMRKRIFDHLL